MSSNNVTRDDHDDHGGSGEDRPARPFSPIRPVSLGRTSDSRVWMSTMIRSPSSGSNWTAMIDRAGRTVRRDRWLGRSAGHSSRAASMTICHRVTPIAARKFARPRSMWVCTVPFATPNRVAAVSLRLYPKV